MNINKDLYTIVYWHHISWDHCLFLRLWKKLKCSNLKEHPIIFCCSFLITVKQLWIWDIHALLTEIIFQCKANKHGIRMIDLVIDLKLSSKSHPYVQFTPLIANGECCLLQTRTSDKKTKKQLLITRKIKNRVKKIIQNYSRRIYNG